MAYLALYRRFRPQGFEGLIGQEHIVKILTNQINTGRIGHAYLFCGARGTGKTTVAKVFARAINCLSPINGTPCGKCEVCLGLKDPSNMDILEMDAASNNGVDDIREMREKIQYPPVVGKYKVYIVDEVHMLSPAAFNALLKTLEEPPAHAVFIFATTEVHKIPQTILSRCMRFDFKLIAQEELAKLVAGIFDSIGKEYEPEAVAAIARAGEGSARDSLSIADMCSSYSVGKLTYNDVLEVLGATDKGRILDLAENIINGNTGGALDEIAALAGLGRNMGVLANDISATLRDLIVCSTSKNANAILCLPKDRFERVKNVSARCDVHRLLRLIDIFTSLDNAFRYSANPRTVLETAVIKACKPQSDYDLEALLARMASLEKQLEEIKKSGVIIKEVPQNAQNQAVTTSAPTVVKQETERGSVQEVKEQVSQKPREEEKPVQPKKQEYNEFDFYEIPPEDDGGFMGIPTPTVQAKPEVKPAATEEVPPAKVWGNVLRTLRTNGNAVLWTVCQDVYARADSNGVLTITVNNDSEYDMFTREDHLKTLTEAANRFGKYVVKINRKAAQSDGLDDFERDVNMLKQTFGEDVVKIIKD